MALPSSAQAAIIAAAVPARPPASVRSSLPCVFQRVELSEFAGLKSTYGCITYGRQARENSLSLFDALASQAVIKFEGNGSSTTNCLALLINILQNEFGGIETGTISATLSSSSGQSLLDGLHCDKRIGRAAGLNIVPTAMDISKTLSQALPSRKLEEKLTGIAMVVPTPNVSVVDLAVHVKKLEDDQEKITVERVNRVFKNAAAGKCLKGILEVSDGQLVSMDYCGSNASAIVDTTLTMVMGENMIRVVAWYDNEWAYSQRLVDLAETVHTKHEEVTSKTECSHFNEQIVEAKCHEYETHFN